MFYFNSGNSVTNNQEQQQQQQQQYALLLGMIYTNDENLKYGLQLQRDGLRCRALEQTSNLKVFTIDMTHEESQANNGQHVTHDFTKLGVLGRMDDMWRGKVFHYVVMDYFRSPNSWSQERWPDTMYTQILPMLATKGAISLEGEIWFPNSESIANSIHKNWEVLKTWFVKVAVADPMNNPLFKASKTIEVELRKVTYFQESVLENLPKEAPFIVLKCIKSGDGLLTNEIRGCGSLSQPAKSKYNLRLNQSNINTTTTISAVVGDKKKKINTQMEEKEKSEEWPMKHKHKHNTGTTSTTATATASAATTTVTATASAATATSSGAEVEEQYVEEEAEVGDQRGTGTNTTTTTTTSTTYHYYKC